MLAHHKSSNSAFLPTPPIDQFPPISRSNSLNAVQLNSEENCLINFESHVDEPFTLTTCNSKIQLNGDNLSHEFVQHPPQLDSEQEDTNSTRTSQELIRSSDLHVESTHLKITNQNKRQKRSSKIDKDGTFHAHSKSYNVAPTARGKNRGGKVSRGRKTVVKSTTLLHDDELEHTRPVKRAAAVNSSARNYRLAERPSCDTLELRPPSTIKELISIQATGNANSKHDSPATCDSLDDVIQRGDACALCRKCEAQTAALAGFRDWVGCDYCWRWIHAVCLHTSMIDIQRLDKFSCPFCVGQRNLLSICDIYTESHLQSATSDIDGTAFAGMRNATDRLSTVSNASLTCAPSSNAPSNNVILRGPVLARVVNARMRTIYCAHANASDAQDPISTCTDLLAQVISPPLSHPPCNDDLFRFNTIPKELSPSVQDKYSVPPYKDNLDVRWWGSSELIRWYQNRPLRQAMLTRPSSFSESAIDCDACRNHWQSTEANHHDPYTYPLSPSSAAISNQPSPNDPLSQCFADLQIPLEFHLSARTPSGSQNTMESTFSLLHQRELLVPTNQTLSALLLDQTPANDINVAHGDCPNEPSCPQTIPTPAVTPHAPLSPTAYNIPACKDR